MSAGFILKEVFVDNEMHDCIVVKNEAERTPVRADIEGLKRLADIHGAGNILNLDGSPYPFPEATMPAIEPVEVVVPSDEGKHKRKIR